MTGRKITEYCIIEATDSVTLTEIVNEHIADDWQPFGHPFLMKHDYEQAMVKYDSGDPWISDFDPIRDRPKPNPTERAC